jgi:hypothetical protein
MTMSKLERQVREYVVAMGYCVIYGPSKTDPEHYVYKVASSTGYLLYVGSTSEEAWDWAIDRALGRVTAEQAEELYRIERRSSEQRVEL